MRPRSLRRLVYEPSILPHLTDPHLSRFEARPLSIPILYPKLQTRQTLFKTLRTFHQTQQRFQGTDNGQYRMGAENNDNMFLTEIRSPSEANFDDGPDLALRTAYRYLKNLPKVEPNGLPADERDCEICLEAYGTNGLDEKIVRLPHCGHR